MSHGLAEEPKKEELTPFQKEIQTIDERMSKLSRTKQKEMRRIKSRTERFKWFIR